MMKTLLVMLVLAVLTHQCPGFDAIPINDSSEESKDVSDDSNESASNESVYLVKEVSYEVGIVHTVDLANSSQVVIVEPEDRIETDDIAIWTAKNESTAETETTTVTTPADTAVETTLSVAPETQQVDKLTSTADQEPIRPKEDTTPANKPVSA